MSMRPNIKKMSKKTCELSKKSEMTFNGMCTFIVVKEEESGRTKKGKILPEIVTFERKETRRKKALKHKLQNEKEGVRKANFNNN